MIVGSPHVHHRRTDSTSERAKELATAGAPHGTLVTADEQTAGHGRQGRTWSAPPGSGLLMSLILRGLGAHQPLLPLAAAVAVCEACERSAPVECRIKWPNDIWVGQRKLAGILVEGRPQEGWAVLGIGLNLSTRRDQFPDELRGTATSLALEAGERAPMPVRLLDALLDALERHVIERPEGVLAAFRARDLLEGRRIGWDGGGGVAAGIDDRGALVVDVGGRLETLDAGEVRLLRPET